VWQVKEGFTRVKRKVQPFADMTITETQNKVEFRTLHRSMSKIPAIYGLPTPLSLAEQ